MHKTSQPEFDRQLTGLLKDAVADVELSPSARTRLAAQLRETAKPARALWSWLVPATVAVAVALLAVTAPMFWQQDEPMTATVEHKPSWIECQATTYSKEQPDQWVRRSLIAHRRNGTESYIMVTAVRELTTPTPNL